ncbi:hypothetical protein E4T56_gene7550, partial [Termitomyces sp. T112]
ALLARLVFDAGHHGAARIDKIDALHAVDGRQLRKVVLEARFGLNHGLAPTSTSSGPDQRTPDQHRDPGQHQRRQQVHEKIGKRHFRRMAKGQQGKGEESDPHTRRRQRKFRGERPGAPQGRNRNRHHRQARRQDKRETIAAHPDDKA